MAITQDRMTKLLAAAEDLHGALKRGLELVKESAERVRNGGEPRAEIESLEAMLAPEFLLQQPLLTLMALEREKEHWTEARVERNAAKRVKRQQQTEHNQGE